MILNRAKDYYENNKELLRERAKNKYRELPANEKHVKRQYQRDRYHNMTAEEKQRLKEYQKNYCEAKKQITKITDIFFNAYMESKILSCGETATIISAFHKKTTSININ